MVTIWGIEFDDNGDVAYMYMADNNDRESYESRGIGCLRLQIVYEPLPEGGTMMKTTRNILAAVLVAAALASCSKTKNPGTGVTPPVQEDKKVNITATVSANEPVSKSPVLDADGSGTFSKGDVIGLLVSGKNGVSSDLRF